MAFSADARVTCMDQSSDFRDQFGTVKTVGSGSDAGSYQIRFDGMGENQTQRMLEEQLKTTTLASPITYDD